MAVAEQDYGLDILINDDNYEVSKIAEEKLEEINDKEKQEDMELE
jgi:hypothetical protein